MPDEKTTKRIAVTPTVYNGLKDLALYGETMDGMLRKLINHYKRTTHRSNDGKYKKQEL